MIILRVRPNTQPHKEKERQQCTYLILVCPPKSHTWNFRFLHVIVSTLKPIAVQKSHHYENSELREHKELL